MAKVRNAMVQGLIMPGSIGGYTVVVASKDAKASAAIPQEVIDDLADADVGCVTQGNSMWVTPETWANMRDKLETVFK